MVSAHVSHAITFFVTLGETVSLRAICFLQVNSMENKRSPFLITTLLKVKPEAEYTCSKLQQ